MRRQAEKKLRTIYVGTRVFMFFHSPSVIDTRLELFRNCSRVTCISSVEHIKGISGTKDGREKTVGKILRIQNMISETETVENFVSLPFELLNGLYRGQFRM